MELFLLKDRVTKDKVVGICNNKEFRHYQNQIFDYLVPRGF